MPQRTVIESLPQAFEMVKELGLQLPGWEGKDWRLPARNAIAQLFQGYMAQEVDRHLEEIASRGETDRRNGYYFRHLLTAMGDIELQVPRTRCFSPVKVVKAYARRTADIDKTILASFILGISTRKVSKVLLGIVGVRWSAASPKAWTLPSRRSMSAASRMSTGCSFSMAWSWRARPARGRSAGQCWWRLEFGPTDARR